MKKVLRNARRLLADSRLRPARWLPMLAALLLVGGGLLAYAQTGGGYDLTWWTVDSGGETVAIGGEYILLTTAGQPDADPAAPSGGGYTLLSGFWPSAKPAYNLLYLPIVLKGSLPDLVGSFSLTPNNPDAGEPVLITAVITNVGTPAADAFWVDFYINPSQVPSVNLAWYDICGMTPCYGMAWYVSGGLAPGQSVTLTSTPDSYAVAYSIWPGYFASGTSDLYLYVDSWNPTVSTGGVLESDETNNLAARQIRVTGLGVADEGLPSPADLPPRPARPGPDGSPALPTDRVHSP